MQGFANARHNHIHHLRTMHDPARPHLRYLCLDCGKTLRNLSGVFVARTLPEIVDYFDRKRDDALKVAANENHATK